MEFQSTLPRGERLDKRSYKKEFQHISIHAPTRGATLRRREQTKQIRDFNPRSHEGSDTIAGTATTSRIRFQSTLPRGERPAELRNSPVHLRNFNPRSHEGSDIEFIYGFLRPEISIHAPTRGATSGLKLFSYVQCNFNPRSHEGSDALLRMNDNDIMISIHAPTRGATRGSNPGHPD